MTILLLLAATYLAIGVVWFIVDPRFSYTVSIDIRSSPELLFDYVADQRTWERFYPSTLVARYQDDEPIRLGTRSIEKYWGLAGYNVFSHEVTRFEYGKAIQWTGRMIHGGIITQLALIVLRKGTGVFTYTFTPSGPNTTWERHCEFFPNSRNPLSLLAFLLYMPFFRIELVRATRVYQRLCKQALEGTPLGFGVP